MIRLERRGTCSPVGIFNIIESEANKGECTCCECGDNRNGNKLCTAVKELGAVFLQEEKNRPAAEGFLTTLLVDPSVVQKIRFSALYCLRANPEILSDDAKQIVHGFENDPRQATVVAITKRLEA